MSERLPAPKALCKQYGAGNLCGCGSTSRQVDSWLDGTINALMPGPADSVTCLCGGAPEHCRRWRVSARH